GPNFGTTMKLFFAQAESAPMRARQKARITQTRRNAASDELESSRRTLINKATATPLRWQATCSSDIRRSPVVPRTAGDVSEGPTLPGVRHLDVDRVGCKEIGALRTAPRPRSGHPGLEMRQAGLCGLSL